MENNDELFDMFEKIDMENNDNFEVTNMENNCELYNEIFNEEKDDMYVFYIAGNPVRTRSYIRIDKDGKANILFNKSKISYKGLFDL